MPRIDVLPSGTSTAQPGYAFVPDTRQVPQALAQHSGGRKRAARNTGVGFGDATVRQQNATLKHLAELDRDNNRDVQIPLAKDGGAKSSKGKTTTNVRRIMMSQKTFANHLADEEAALAQKPTSASQGPAQVRRVSAVEGRPTHQQQDTEMDDDPVEAEHLLHTYAPTAPSEQVMQALVTAPPLSYNAARATLTGPRKPPRHFCEICGYWGNIKCLKCGARVCGLDCKGAHDEGRCLNFYG